MRKIACLCVGHDGIVHDTASFGVAAGPTRVPHVSEIIAIRFPTALTGVINRSSCGLRTDSRSGSFNCTRDGPIYVGTTMCITSPPTANAATCAEERMCILNSDRRQDLSEAGSVTSGTQNQCRRRVVHQAS